MNKGTILIIDDEPNIRVLLEGLLQDEGFITRSAENAETGLKEFETFLPDCVLLDVWLPDRSGLDLLEDLKQRNPEVQIIMISGHASVDVAVKALKKGAFDFLEKPLKADRVISLVQNATELNVLKRENRKLRRQLGAEEEMIGESPAMKKLRSLIDKAAQSDISVFIMGENGTGKELVAREIHRQSARFGKPFVAVNCAAIPDTLIESELFGHEKGAFTGAVSQKKGRFELAHQGTLFMDEVIDLSLPAQAKVLRALQEQKFERVGGLQTVSVDVRVVAASNKDPHQAMADKQFREDLFYRLHVLPLLVPPLRERKEDIPLLIRYFADNLQPLLDGTKDFTLDDEGMKLLCEYSWPGNIRQLKNIVQRIMVMSSDSVIGKKVVEFALEADRPLEKKIDSDLGNSENLQDYEGMALSEARESFEKAYILQKLEEQGYNISRTAEMLGMYPSHLHGKMKKLGIQTPK